MIALAGFALSAALALCPQLRSQPALHPQTYVSPSGDWAVTVDPTKIHGQGPGDYEATHDGERAWSVRLPFTLYDAVVDDAGYVAGYAYTNGLSDPREMGEFVVALISPAGKVIAAHSTPRKPSPQMHSAPDPVAAGLLLDRDVNRFVVRLAHVRHGDFREPRDGNKWLAFDMRDGKQLDEFIPDEKAAKAGSDARASFVYSASAVEGAPLYVTVGARLRFDREPAVHDLVIDVFDLHGEPVASLTHNAEIEDTRDLREAAARDCLIDESVPEGFGVWLPRSAKRVEYRVARAPGGRGWSIEELTRADYEPVDLDGATGPKATTLELELLSEVELEAQAAKPGLFESVRTFGFDDLGRLLVLEEDDELEGAATCYVVTPENELVLERRFEIPLTNETATVQWWPFETGCWLVTVNWMDESYEPYGQAWWADPKSGELTELTEWPLSTIEGVASTRDGGFVACGSSTEHSVAITNFGSFDADGSARWLHRGPSLTVGSGDHFMPDDVAVTKEGHVVTVSSVGGRIQCFGLDGTWRETIELASAWDDTPGYPSSIQADPFGAVVVVDAHVEPSIRRLESDGTVREAVSPRREDGSMDSVMPYRVRVAPDGRLWTTDGYVLMRLGTSGTADRTLGGLPSPDELAQPGPILIDRRTKRVAIQDERTMTLHVFDAVGARLFVARPEAGDYDDGSYYGSRLAFAPDGRVFVSSITLPEKWLAFDLEGNRIGPANLGGVAVVFGGGEQRWVVTLGRAELIDAAGTALGAIERRADRSWLSGIADLDVAPDGSVAVLDRPRGREVRQVSVYAPDGTPERDFSLPRAESGQWRVRYGGAWIVVTGFEGPAWLLRLADATWHRFEPDWMDMASGDILRTVVPIGSELWCVDPFARRLRRYALPRE